jgi:RNA polymerase sigma factor (sigma-70 family)
MVEPDPALEEEKRKFADLMWRVCEGDREAIEQVIQEYGPYLRRVIRRRLRKCTRLRQLFDSEDFMEMVWGSFFCRIVPKIPHEIPMETDEDLRAYLGAMGANKVAQAERDHLHMQKRSLLRQQSLNDPEVEGKDDLHSKDLSPEDSARLEEYWERLEKLYPPNTKRILALRKLGCTSREIADQTGLRIKTVQRILADLEKKIEQEEQ